MAVAFGAVLLGLVAVIATAAFGLHSIEGSIEELVRVASVKSDLPVQMRLAIVSRADRIRNVALTSEVNAMQADLQVAEAQAKAYFDLRERLLALGLSAVEKDALDRADAAEKQAGPVLKLAIAQARSMQPENAAKMLTERLQPIQRDWLDALQALTEATAAGRADFLLQAQGTRGKALLWMLGVGSVALLAGGVLAAAIARSVSRRLRVAVEVTQRVASGDLTDSGSGDAIDLSDEVARTLQALESMRARLHQTVGAVRSAAADIDGALTEIAAGTQDLSARTEHSSARLQATSSALAQISVTVRDAAQNAISASQLAEAAAAVAERGGAMVGRVQATMGDISANSRRINEIIGVIDGISFQTNILALNAAVEAARAGEQGRGFAIVASEVRSLAQRSASAAKEIKSLIGQSSRSVEAGAELVSEAGATMGEIVTSVQRVVAVIEQITAYASSQEADIGKIHQAVSDLDEMTQQNAALVEQSAAATAGMRIQSARLTEAVGAFSL